MSPYVLQPEVEADILRLSKYLTSIEPDKYPVVEMLRGLVISALQRQEESK